MKERCWFRRLSVLGVVFCVLLTVIICLSGSAVLAQENTKAETVCFHNISKTVKQSSRREELLLKLKTLQAKAKKIRRKYMRAQREGKAALEAILLERLNRIRDRVKRLKKRLFPCSVESGNNVKINLINDSELLISVYLNQQNGPDRYFGQAAPGQDSEIIVNYTDLYKVGAAASNKISFIATYPDGSELPSDEGLTNPVIKYFAARMKKKRTKGPCYTNLRYILTNSDFSTSGIIPPQQGDQNPVQIESVDYDSQVISDAPAQDLIINYSGSPFWPVTARLYPLSCPAGVNCVPVTTTFYASSVSGSKVLNWVGAMWCQGFSQNTSFSYAVELIDSEGNKSNSVNVPYTCVVN